MKKHHARSVSRTAGLLCPLLLWSAVSLTAAEPVVERMPAAITDSGHHRWQKRWVASCVALAAVNVLDLHSSRGRWEGNPLLRDPTGRFSPGKAILVKGAVGGGFLAAQLWLVHRHPQRDYYKPFTMVNSFAAGGLAGVAIHNYGLPPPPRK